MTEFREVKLTTDDLRVEFETKSRFDKVVSCSPVIEVGVESDEIINRSVGTSMTEFREVRTTEDDVIVEIEVKSQSDKDFSHSPVIEVGGERDTSINNSTTASMTEFREGKSDVDDLRV